MGLCHSLDTLVPEGEHTPQRFQETIKHTQWKREIPAGKEGTVLVGTTHTCRLRNNAALTSFIVLIEHTGKELPLEGNKRLILSSEKECCLQWREQSGPQAAFLKGWVVPESSSGFFQTLWNIHTLGERLVFFFDSHNIGSSLNTFMKRSSLFADIVLMCPFLPALIVSCFLLRLQDLYSRNHLSSSLRGAKHKGILSMTGTGG